MGVWSWVLGIGCWVFGVGFWQTWVRHGALVSGLVEIWSYPLFSFYGPLWALILPTEESWVMGVIDIGSGLSGLLGLVWTEIGCLDGQKSVLVLGLGCS